MCGISGELRFDDMLADTSAVTRMSDKITRCGPDHAGVFSDGGLDSSLLVGLLADHVDDLQTFSMGFETLGSEKADEFEFTDQVAAQFKTRHHKCLSRTTECRDSCPKQCCRWPSRW